VKEKLMVNPCKFFLPVILLLVIYPSSIYSFEGPLRVKNHYPLFLHANQPFLEKALIEDAFSMSLSHSSTHTVQSSGDWDINLDMEITELNLGYRKTMKDLLELNIELPFLVFGSGFMDGFLNEYHSTFGFSDYGRSERPLNKFLYEVRRDGRTIVLGETGMGLGDIRIAIKNNLLSAEDYVLSIKGDIEIPTGNAKKGYGNGSVDAGFSILLDKYITDVLRTYWNVGAVFPGDLRGHETLDLKNFVYGGVVLEVVLWKNFHFIAQLQGQSEIFPGTELSAVDGAGYILAFGGRYSTEKSGLELSLTEDINTSGAPDFIINLSYSVNL
jgi:hypothetical protein